MEDKLTVTDIIAVIILSVCIAGMFYIANNFKKLPEDKQLEVLQRCEILIKQFSDKYYYNEVWQKETREGNYRSLKMRSL